MRYYATQKIYGTCFYFRYEPSKEKLSTISQERVGEMIAKYGDLVKQFVERIIGARDYAKIYGTLYYNFLDKSIGFMAEEVLADDKWIDRETLEYYFQFTDIPLIPIFAKGTQEELTDRSSPILEQLEAGIPIDGWVIKPYKYSEEGPLYKYSGVGANHVYC